MTPHYNQSYTREQINAVLNKIKSCVEQNRYTISLNENRQENIDFINEYNIRSDKQRAILIQIETDDFCHSLQNTKIGFEHEVLIDLPSGSRTIVISFHKRNKPIDYLFI